MTNASTNTEHKLKAFTLEKIRLLAKFTMIDSFIKLKRKLVIHQ